MIFAEHVKNSLLSLIQEMASLPWLFAKNPAADFSRNRKLDFASTIQCILSMENGGLKNELLDFFRFSVDTPSASAFHQQRSKLLPETFPFLFHEFAEERYELVGEHTGKTYKLGQKVRVSVTEADRIQRTVNFEII